MFWSSTPTRSTSSLARLLTRCACFVMVRCFCYHMPAGLHAIATEHGVGTHRFCSTLCSAFDLVSFPLGRTSVLGLELGTRLPFVVRITDEIAPLSWEGHRSVQIFRNIPSKSIFCSKIWKGWLLVNLLKFDKTWRKRMCFTLESTDTTSHEKMLVVWFIAMRSHLSSDFSSGLTSGLTSELKPSEHRVSPTEVSQHVMRLAQRGASHQCCEAVVGITWKFESAGTRQLLGSLLGSSQVSPGWAQQSEPKCGELCIHWLTHTKPPAEEFFLSHSPSQVHGTDNQKSAFWSFCVFCCVAQILFGSSFLILFLIQSSLSFCNNNFSALCEWLIVF